jgi:hypothetical protein
MSNKLKLVDQLPSIEVQSPFEQAIDPTEIDEQLATSGEQQLRHANQQLELTRRYPGRDHNIPMKPK